MAASQLAVHKSASLLWAPVRSSAWFMVVSGLEVAARMFSEKALGWNLLAKMWLKYQDDSTSLWMAGRAMLQRIGSH